MIGTCACGKHGRLRRNMCDNCYHRWYRRRTPEQRQRQTLEERFWEKVNQDGPLPPSQAHLGRCWLWTGATSRRYGRFWVDGRRRNVKAHSFSLELATGTPCPQGQWGLHRCDNPPCVNPSHIYFGTPLQNSADAVERGLLPLGEKRGGVRLTGEQVLAIRERFDEGVTLAVLRAEYGVGAATISRIVNGKGWKHIGGPISMHKKRGPRPRRRPDA